MIQLLCLTCIYCAVETFVSIVDNLGNLGCVKPNLGFGAYLMESRIYECDFAIVFTINALGCICSFISLNTDISHHFGHLVSGHLL